MTIMPSYVTTSFNLPSNLKKKIDSVSGEDHRTATSIMIDALNLYFMVRENMLNSFSIKINNFNEGKTTLTELSHDMGVSEELMLSFLKKGTPKVKKQQLKTILDKVTHK